MKIVLAGYTLCDPANPLDSLTLNGVRVVEVADMARAASASIFVRGNSKNTLSFSVSRVFGSYADAQDYALLIEATAPTVGALVITQTGADADRAPVTCGTAALASVVPTLQGVRVSVAFTIQAGRFAGGNPPGLLTETDAPNTMRSAVPIPTGFDSVGVVFPAALAAAPIVTGLSLVVPPNVDSPGILRAENVTGQGMTVRLTGPVPAGCVLHWEVKPATVAAA